jgi:hypothetical protein
VPIELPTLTAPAAGRGESPAPRGAAEAEVAPKLVPITPAVTMLTIIASIERPTLFAAMIPRPIDRLAPKAAHNGPNTQAACHALRTP